MIGHVYRHRKGNLLRCWVHVTAAAEKSRLKAGLPAMPVSDLAPSKFKDLRIRELKDDIFMTRQKNQSASKRNLRCGHRIQKQDLRAVPALSLGEPKSTRVSSNLPFTQAI